MQISIISIVFKVIITFKQFVLAFTNIDNISDAIAVIYRFLISCPMVLLFWLYQFSGLSLE